jgi:hypothetical protein
MVACELLQQHKYLQMYTWIFEPMQMVEIFEFLNFSHGKNLKLNARSAALSGPYCAPPQSALRSLLPPDPATIAAPPLPPVP